MADNTSINIGKASVGAGIPCICVPVAAASAADIVSQMKHISRECKNTVDIIELRIDYFDGAADIAAVKELLAEIRRNIGEMPVLFTFRTALEGGERSIAPDLYRDLLSEAAATGMIDAVDVELMQTEVFDDILAAAHRHGVTVIASNHDFKRTPEAEELLKRLKMMESRGADIAKIAVMPSAEEDVITLLTASLRAKRTLNIPVITISMGKLGAVSRIAGETFGSAVTFGVADRASAPGQLPAEELKRTLELLH